MTCQNEFFYYYYYFDNLVTAFFEKRGGLINFRPLKRGRLIEDLQYSTLYFLIGF